MEFKVGGVRYFVSFGFFAVLALYMLFDRAGVGLPALAGVALHESGHIAALHLTGAEIAALRLYPFGVQLEKRGLLSYGREAAVYLGGVAANAVAILCFLPFTGWNLFCAVNAALALFNLLPVGRLDGGVLLELALCRCAGPVKARRISLAAGFCILAPLFAAGFWMALRGNYTLLLTAIYLSVALLRS